jgi:hypothetical protein
MRRPLLWVLGLGLVLAGLGMRPAQAAPLKPVAVVTISGYDELMGDLEFVGEISGRPELATGLKGMISLTTGGKGLEGLDKSKPLGAVVQTDGEKFHGYTFVPVTDLKKLLEVLEPMAGKITDVGDGVVEVQTNQGRTFYVKEKRPGWAIICDSKEALARAPADPLAAIGDLNKKYDLAARVYVHNIPEKFRQAAITRVKEGAERQSERRPGESDAEYAVRKKLSDQSVEAAITAINELEQVSLGWSLNHKVGDVHLDLSATVLPGSDAARTLADMAQAKSNLAGFLVPGAAVVGNWLSQVPTQDVAALAEAIQAVRPRIMEGIEKKAQSPEAAKEQKELAGNVLDVVQKTVASGRTDAAMSLVLGPEAVTLVAGAYVADGPTLEKTFEALAEMARAQHPDAVNRMLKMNAGQCRGVNLHTVSIPIPPNARNREETVKLVGQTLEVVVGVGKESVCVAAGRDAMKALRQAIERSAEGAENVTPAKLSLAADPIAKFIAAVGRPARQREAAAKVVAALEKMPSGKDHVNLEVNSIERGVQLRLEIEPDVVKLLGLMAKERVD